MIPQNEFIGAEVEVGGDPPGAAHAGVQVPPQVDPSPQQPALCHVCGCNPWAEREKIRVTVVNGRVVVDSPRPAIIEFVTDVRDVHDEFVPE